MEVVCRQVLTVNIFLLKFSCTGGTNRTEYFQGYIESAAVLITNHVLNFNKTLGKRAIIQNIVDQPLFSLTRLALVGIERTELL